MKFIAFSSALTLILSTHYAQAETSEGYYGAARYLQNQQRASDMDTSVRPGVGEFVAGNEKAHKATASLALGYQWGNNWRTEGEYTFAQHAEFTSGSSTFASSYNHLQTDVQRFMLNVYRDFSLGHDIALYGTAGLGISHITAQGWQGNGTRRYASASQNNFTYSIGAGVSYMPLDALTIDAGYRYVDMGKIESGYNSFVNARGLKDEQMKAHLVENQLMLGLRYQF